MACWEVSFLISRVHQWLDIVLTILILHFYNAKFNTNTSLKASNKDTANASLSILKITLQGK